MNINGVFNDPSDAAPSNKENVPRNVNHENKVSKLQIYNVLQKDSHQFEELAIHEKKPKNHEQEPKNYVQITVNNSTGYVKVDDIKRIWKVHDPQLFKPENSQKLQKFMDLKLLESSQAQQIMSMGGGKLALSLHQNQETRNKILATIYSIGQLLNLSNKGLHTGEGVHETEYGYAYLITANGVYVIDNPDELSILKTMEQAGASQEELLKAVQVTSMLIKTLSGRVKKFNPAALSKLPLNTPELRAKLINTLIVLGRSLNDHNEMVLNEDPGSFSFLLTNMNELYIKGQESGKGTSKSVYNTINISSDVDEHVWADIVAEQENSLEDLVLYNKDPETGRGMDAVQGTLKEIQYLRLLKNVPHMASPTKVEHLKLNREHREIKLVYLQPRRIPTREEMFGVLDTIDLETSKTKFKMNAEDMLRVGQNLAEGLAGIHAKGLVHSDIKPANFLLKVQRGRVQEALISDLGTMGKINSTIVSGTMYYIAPEVGRSFAAYKLDPKLDSFSLGVVLMEMVSGKPYIPVSDGEKISNKAVFRCSQEQIDTHLDNIHRSIQNSELLESDKKICTQILLVAQKLLQRDVNDRISCDQAFEELK